MTIDKRNRIILASASPRRRELLELVNVEFEVIPADVDESMDEGEEPGNAVMRLAELKASCVADKYTDRFILAADTIVVYSNSNSDSQDSVVNEILGKPNNLDEALMTLNKLNGVEHKVMTAFCLCAKSEDLSITRLVETVVKFRNLTEGEIQDYLETGEGDDKAGAYAIQGIGGSLVEYIRGSYHNVVGLPTAQVIEELKSYGLWFGYKQ